MNIKKTIRTILLVMVGFDLILHILDFNGHSLFIFPSFAFYEIFWITYWGIAFLLLLYLRFKTTKLK